ncbi:MAG: helix-turn-helix domain-containing protein [Eubacteriales bacterium]|nr:helix-turn-helix domain-containing protein [Eubacteriales bacterium]
MKDTLVQSVKKAAGIIDILVFSDIENGGIGLFDMARQLGLKPNTLHNLLKTLVHCGYVEQRPDSKYVAGPKCKAIGTVNIYAANTALNKAMRSKVTELSKKIDSKLAGALGCYASLYRCGEGKQKNILDELKKMAGILKDELFRGSRGSK